MHLLSKCPDIPDNCLEKIRNQCKESYLNGIQNKSEVKIRVKVREKLNSIKIL